MSQQQIVDELRAMQPIIEAITGLSSRWSGVVNVMDGATMALLKGRIVWADKEWGCAITIHEAMVEQPVRWRSLIHEMLHSVSPGMSSEDYKRLQGWEEAVVEQVQRYIRPDVLARLNIDVPETVFAPQEAIWPYNNYIEAAEDLRRSVDMPIERFYLDLLKVPLAQRPAYVRSLRNDLEYRRLFAMTVGKMR